MLETMIFTYEYRCCAVLCTHYTFILLIALCNDKVCDNFVWIILIFFSTIPSLVNKSLLVIHSVYLNFRFCLEPFRSTSAGSLSLPPGSLRTSAKLFVTQRRETSRKHKFPLTRDNFPTSLVNHAVNWILWPGKSTRGLTGQLEATGSAISNLFCSCFLPFCIAINHQAWAEI